ncbi:MAG: toll/interleukin-1 receptor domain-containing protein [Erysipelothrix sp.]
MKVFLSWSKPHSKEIAAEFKTWIQTVIQSCDVFMSDTDIELGSVWNDKIKGELRDSDLGIIFVTEENMSSPWVNFEVGALSFAMEDTRVIPVLLDVEEVGNNPMSQYQAAKKFDRENMLKLISSINSAQKERKLPDEVLKNTFNAFWESFQGKITGINGKYSKGKKNKSKLSPQEQYELITKKLDLLESISRESLSIGTELIMGKKNDEYFNSQVFLRQDFSKTIDDLRTNRISVLHLYHDISNVNEKDFPLTDEIDYYTSTLKELIESMDNSIDRLMLINDYLKKSEVKNKKSRYNVSVKV